MKLKLTHISLAVVATTMLMGSTAVFAHNYKGEGNYKGEAMAAPAAPCVQPLTLRDGFYLGAQIGYDQYNTRATNAVTVGGAAYSANPVLASNGFIGGIFGGYGMTWNNWFYLAGELFVSGSGASQSQNYLSVNATSTNNQYNKVSAGTSWGISALPGLKVNDSTLAYVRLGYSGARIKGTSAYTTTSPAGVVLGAPLNGSKTNWQGGFNYGLGMETAVWQNISVRGEVNHTSYSSFNGPTGTKYSPADTQALVGLIYHFA